MSNLVRMRPLGSTIALLLAVPLLVGSCDGENSPVGATGAQLAEQCGLTCPVNGIVQGNFAISGVAGVDAFFAAVVNFDTKAKLVAANIQAELDAIAVSVGLQPGAAAADIKAAIVAKFKLDASGGIAIAYKPAECAVTAKAVVEANAKCEGKVDPGSVEVECKGSCEAQASATATCDASATMVCHGTAPELSCSGTCQGSCQLDVAAACSGTCNGECTGTCSAKNASGQCQGKCEGTCKGTCELTAGGSCSGKCQGECAYTPPSGGCEAGARVECKAEANASVKCNGKCNGDFEPPQAKAECQASAKADAKVNVECTPPSIDVVYKFSAEVEADAAAKATAEGELKAWLVSFKASMGKITAQIKQGEVVVDAGAGIAAAAGGFVNSFKATAEAETNLKAKIGLGCALIEFGKVGGVITGATTELQAKLTAAGSMTAALK
jgi:hypothetical protein